MNPIHEHSWPASASSGHDMSIPSFARIAKDVVKTYRGELLEASLASLFIGILAFTTSLFSMQVYDRVIPTRSEYTLWVLSIGVLLSLSLIHI